MSDIRHFQCQRAGYGHYINGGGVYKHYECKRL